MNGIQFRANRVVLIPPANVGNATATSDVINMKDCPVATIVLQFGALHDSSDSDLVVLGNDSTTASGGTALATLKYRIQETTGTWGAWTKVTDSKIDIVTGGDIDPATADDAIMEIELNASDIEAGTTGDKYFYMTLSAPGQTSWNLSAHAVMNNQRYQADIPESVVV